MGVPLGTKALKLWSRSKQGLKSELLYMSEQETLKAFTTVFLNFIPDPSLNRTPLANNTSKYMYAYHLYTQWASSTATATTRLHSGGSTSLCSHLSELSRASGALNNSLYCLRAMPPSDVWHAKPCKTTSWIIRLRQDSLRLRL